MAPFMRVSETEWLREEVERLQADVKTAKDAATKYWAKFQEKCEEVERLRASKAVMEAQYQRALDDNYREVERLRDEQDAAIAVASEWKMQAKESEAEVERLRAQLEMYAGMPAVEVEAREAEVERLRKQNADWERTARAYEKDFERLRAQKEYLEELLHAERALKGGE